jgi:hypothetical protein
LWRNGGVINAGEYSSPSLTFRQKRVAEIAKKIEKQIRRNVLCMILHTTVVYNDRIIIHRLPCVEQ